MGAQPEGSSRKEMFSGLQQSMVVYCQGPIHPQEALGSDEKWSKCQNPLWNPGLSNMGGVVQGHELKPWECLLQREEFLQSQPCLANLLFPWVPGFGSQTGSGGR